MRGLSLCAGVVVAMLLWAGTAAAASPTVRGPIYPLPGYNDAAHLSRGGSGCNQQGDIATGNGILQWTFGGNSSTTAPATGMACGNALGPFDTTRTQALYWGLDLTSPANNQFAITCVGPQPCPATTSGPMSYDAADSTPANGILVYQGLTNPTDKLHLTFTLGGAGGTTPLPLTDASTIGSLSNPNANGPNGLLGFVAAAPNGGTFTVSAQYTDNGTPLTTVIGGTCFCHAQTDITGGFYYVDLPPGGTISTTPDAQPANHTGETFSLTPTEPYTNDGDQYTVAWDMTGGTNYSTPDPPPMTSFGPGQHTVAALVTDTTDGLSTRVEDNFTITNQAPTGSISVLQPGTDPPGNHTITTFVANVSDPDRGNDGQCAAPTYVWDVSGNMNFSPGESPNQNVNASFGPGQHTVDLQITDCDGAQTVVTKTFTINNQPPMGTIASTPSQPLNHQPVTFSIQGLTDPDRGNDGSCAAPTITGWDLTGGTNYTTADPPPATSFGPGQHTVAALLTDCDGGTTRVADTFTIASVPPVAAFSCAPAAPMAHQTVVCTSTSHDPDAASGDTLTYKWTIGTSTTALGTNNTFTLSNKPAGTDAVKLSVTDRDGNTTSVTHNVVFKAATASVAITTGQRLAGVLTTGIKAKFTANDATSAPLSLTVTKATSKAGQPLTITGIVGTAKPTLTKAGTVAFTIVLTSTGKQKLSQAKSATFALTGTAKDKYGNAVPIHVVFTLS